MALEIRQVQKLAQQLVMTPQLQQAIKLLQLSRLELEEMVLKELQENPALEEGASEETESNDQPRVEAPGEPAAELAELTVNRELSAVDKIGTLDWQEYLDTHSNSMHSSLTAEAMSEDGDAPPSWENSLTKKTSLEDHLIWQLRLSKITEKESAIGLYVIQNLNENGYLTLTVEEVCSATETTPEDVEAILKRIQFFDPVGVAARNLRECLLIQLENLHLSDTLAARIVADYISFLESKRYEKLAKDLGVTIDDIADAAHLIASLEPKPSRGYEQDEVRTVLPDVFVEKIDGEYIIYLNDDGVPRLRVSSLYRRMAGQEGAAEEQARQYLQEKVRAATWLIKSIQQRQQTLFRVTQSIFKFQQEFLDHGVSRLKPMVLRDVAEDIHMHESTVSRATANKYVHTPQGLFELKFFFQSGLRSGSGEDVASESVKEKIRGIVGAEDARKPYSDQHIAGMLSTDSIDIARRTVAKYREAMGILPSSKRRQPFLRR
ncbi:MAG: polymerase sigma-54 factor [Candidatus Binatota bacterium]|jgi:RNA polymerase sigma-54 factor|nr:polymerase sigma-54 factor [Candidatus Binatota bacterium]HMF47259.1 RNA polymerase factor sigma-54 [Candidatus Saccharimonadales bacterium]